MSSEMELATTLSKSTFFSVKLLIQTPNKLLHV